MTATGREKQLHGNNVEVLSRQSDCTVYRMRDGTGDARLTSYAVFPGITLTYHNVHMQQCAVDRHPEGKVLEIHHCREGRMECAFQDEFFYLTRGDVSISGKGDAGYESYFPISQYQGIAILIEIERAPRCLSCFLDEVTVQPAALLRKFCSERGCAVLRASPCLEHIFSELYAVPACIRRGYLKVKVLEILLYLSGMDLSDRQKSGVAYSRAQVELAKRCCAYISAHMDARVTINQLAERFHVSTTQLKNSFKGVYGTSVYTYIRTQKMQAAAVLLRETDDTVLSIAGRCGYDNGSKFAKAFRDIVGVSPNEYRVLRQTVRSDKGGEQGKE